MKDTKRREGETELKYLQRVIPRIVARCSKCATELDRNLVCPACGRAEGALQRIAARARRKCPLITTDGFGNKLMGC